MLDAHFQQVINELLSNSTPSEQQAQIMWQKFIDGLDEDLIRQLRLNSVEVDLTSYKQQLEQLKCH